MNTNYVVRIFKSAEMQIRSGRIERREGVRRRRCHGRLRRQQESRAGVRILGCDVVNFVMNVTGDDELERRGRRGGRWLRVRSALPW